MFTKILGTFRKYYYNVIDGDNHIKLDSSKGDINTTGEILKKENDIEELEEDLDSQEYLLNTLTEFYSFKKSLDKIVPLSFILTFGLAFLPYSILNLILATILSVVDVFGGISYILAIIKSAPTKKRYETRKNKINSQIDDVKKRLEIQKSELITLKKQYRYQEIADLDSDSLESGVSIASPDDFQNRIKVLSLVKKPKRN